jgi:hypothetical protein
MGSNAPPRPAPQQLRALARANQVRRARAELKRKIENGEMSVPEVLVACPSHAATMSISDLLMSQRWWGRTRSRRLLVSIGVPERKSVGNLTERQRTEMAALLTLRARLASHRHRPVATPPA